MNAIALLGRRVIERVRGIGVPASCCYKFYAQYPLGLESNCLSTKCTALDFYLY